MDTNLTRRTAIKRFTTAGAGLTLGSGLLSASAFGKRSSGPIKVGVLTDLTGPYAVVGTSNQAVAQFAIDEINAAGGVIGRKLQAVVADGASDPATCATAANQLVIEDKVAMVIGGITSAEREAVKGIIATRGATLYLWPASYEGGECDANVWSCGAVPNQQTEPVVKYVLSKGAKTFYLCGDEYLYPQVELQRVKGYVKAGGGTIVGEQYVPLNITDPSALVSDVLASNADVLFEIVVLPATAPFITGVVAGGFKGTICSTLFDQGITPLFGKDAQGLLSAQDYFPSISRLLHQAEGGRVLQEVPKGHLRLNVQCAGVVPGAASVGEGRCGRWLSRDLQGRRGDEPRRSERADRRPRFLRPQHSALLPRHVPWTDAGRRLSQSAQQTRSCRAAEPVHKRVVTGQRWRQRGRGENLLAAALVAAILVSGPLLNSLRQASLGHGTDERRAARRARHHHGPGLGHHRDLYARTGSVLRGHAPTPQA